MSDPTIHCSFCGKSTSEVEFMVAGNNCYICNECVDQCSCIITEERNREV